MPDRNPRSLFLARVAFTDIPLTEAPRLLARVRAEQAAGTWPAGPLHDLLAASLEADVEVLAAGGPRLYVDGPPIR